MRMTGPKPSKNCPYCGSTKLRVKRWNREGTYFVACDECKATGPSLARTPEEAVRLFDHRAETIEQMTIGGL